MASPTFHLSTPSFCLKKILHPPRSSIISRHHIYRSSPNSLSFPPSFIKLRRSNSSSNLIITCAYVSAPASDPNITENDESKLDQSNSPETTVRSHDPPATISWPLVFSLLLRHKLQLAISVATLIGCTSCTLTMPILSGQFFEVIIGAKPDPLWKLLSTIAVFYTLEPIFTIIFVTNLNTVWEKVMTKLRAIVFRRILIQKVEFFDRYKVGELTGLLTSDLGSIKNVVSENISRDRGFRAFSEVFLQPLTNCELKSQAIYKRSTVPVFKAHGMAQASISDCASETFSAIRTVRSFGGEKRQMSTFGNQILAYQSSGTKLGIFRSANEAVTRIVVYVSLLTLYCLGGSKVKAGELSAGTVASFIGYTFTLTFAVQGLVNTFGDLRGTLAAIERINFVLSGTDTDDSLAYGLERELNEKEVCNESLKLFYNEGFTEENFAPNKRFMSALKSASNGCSVAWSGDICLEDVHFSYPLRPDVKVLSGLNLTLKCGTVTALPTRGRITVSGEDVRTFDKSEWARVVSIVNQEPVLFSASVGENIAYGLPDDNVSKDAVIKAAKAANAHEFIISLPQGYDTLVGERGGLLSGGQRQRVAIARALLKNAPILILDEATSALDAVSERLVQDALNQLMKGRTTLVIAHRLSTVQNAHQIALCSDGKIEELGTHSELLARKGQYASLVGTQRLAFE
ncbi:hypothetical protein IFM89_035068 [Coptis chinensis]|uniref:ABC transporter B family member 28 n=1 Tax=Coptis chinensis TaxID=261450 RepID=A0A835MB04_9MAGN|nr:hypothetical protein IFM89_035068 [Coptis chinensis]